MDLASKHRLDAQGVARRPTKFLSFRVSGMLGIALIALLVPAVGDNRFWVAGILAIVGAPAAVWLNLRAPMVDNGWLEPLMDLLLVVGLVHLVPEVWHAALCVALMVALAPSVGLHPLSYRIYTAFAVILVVGMVFAAVLHGVSDWILPIAVVLVVYPSVIFYAHWQTRRADELRERAQLLKGLNQVAGSVAHDFNNMLMAISGHAELAQLDLPPDHPAAGSVAEVLQGAKRAAMLCNQLLAFSGRKVQSNAVIDLQSEVSVIVGLMEPVVPKGVRLVLEPAMQPFLVKGDRAELQQVMMNVVLNAGEAISQVPAEINLRLRRQIDESGAWVLLEVDDHGKGISSNELEHIFEPFYTSKSRGHGLGLASAQRIMKTHGGSIVVESQEGVGTHVELRLPEAIAVDAAPTQTAVPAPERQGPILVVDDDAQVRDVAQRYLGKLGFRVVLAADADEAYSAFVSDLDAFAGVLLDLKMPGKDGWQCLAELRAVRPDIPVIVCSGFDPVGMELSRVASPVTFLAKPFRLLDLRSALNQVLAEVPAEARVSA